MFDIGFWELTIIGVVALLVIGPERLPRVARTAGLWLGRASRRALCDACPSRSNRPKGFPLSTDSSDPNDPANDPASDENIGTRALLWGQS